MTTFLTIFHLVISLLLSIIEAIKTIEAASAKDGQGSLKIGFLREILEATFEAGKDGTITFDEAWPVIQKVSGATVSFFNAVGVFKKST